MNPSSKNSPSKGWICLDIDGTLTDEILSIPNAVLNTLKELHQDHWKIVFVTGRLFTLANKVLETLGFPYHLVPQNGASWYEMPSKKRGGKRYLPLATFLELQPLLTNTSLDFLLVSGREEGDQCFYRPDHLTDETCQHFRDHLSKYGGHWKAVSSFNELEVGEFPYGKIYGPKKELEELLPRLKKVSSIQTHLVQDSARKNYSIIQIMRHDVSKGSAVLELIGNNVLPTRIISAGNDLNDETLLDIADIKIVMPSAPKLLLDKADIIAPPVEECGIIPALKMAVKQAEAL